MPTKEKLTLSVDKEVVQRAKELGINISEVTEQVLKGFTFEPTKVEESQVLDGYKELFRTMLPLMRKFNTSVRIGDHVEVMEGSEPISFTLSLLPDGAIYSDDFEKDIPFDKISIDDLLPPNEILKEFIKSSSEGAKKQKQRLKEVKAVQQIIKAVSEFMK